MENTGIFTVTTEFSSFRNTSLLFLLLNTTLTRINKQNKITYFINYKDLIIHMFKHRRKENFVYFLLYYYYHLKLMLSYMFSLNYFNYRCAIF